jgi:gamma-glutamylcyclotransferase (GGCT)/AIG2-like uncharacterized protein YtfP
MTLPSPGYPERLPIAPVTLFAYGTLTFPEVVRVLLGRVPDSTPAAVAGWRIAAIPGRVYPAMVTAEAIAHGRLITGLTELEWRVVDAFEDGIYELDQLTLTDGRQAWAYICENRDAVSSDDWDAEQFERHHLVAYLKRCSAWRREYQGDLNQR